MKINSIVIIAKTILLKFSGSWEVSPEQGNLLPGSVTYDYLMTIEDVNHAIYFEDIPGIKKMLQRVREQKKFVLTIRCHSPDGKIYQLHGQGELDNHLDPFNIFPQFNESASEDLPFHSASDGNTGTVIERVKENYRPQQESIASRNLLQAVFNTSTLGLHVLKSIRDDKGVIVDFDIILANETSDKIAGRKVSGLRMLEGWPHTGKIGLFEKFVRTVESGSRLECENLYEGDGVRAWFKWSASRLDDGLYVTIEDITERKKAEEDLQTTAARLQSTFDGVPATIALLEAVYDDRNEPVDFVVSAANKAMSEFTPLKGTNIIGKTMTQLYPETFHSKVLEAHLAVFKTGEPVQMEFLYNEINRWFSLFLSKQVDGHGIVAAAIEITALKKGEEQRKKFQMLTELNAAKNEFFSNVSHEFRTPLTLILGPLQDMRQKFNSVLDDQENMRQIELAYRNALRLEKLVNSLLNFSRIEAGRSDTIFKPVDLAEYTTLLAGNFRSAVQRVGLDFVVDCESTEPIYVNPDMWEKIVLNLLSNALKFTFEGRIEIRLKAYKKHVKLLVRDTGIGISPLYHLKIFEKFTRIPHARSRSHEGSGIGLALVNELVRIHGGGIDVSSQEGSGSLFTVSIPKGKTHLPADCIYEMRDKAAISPLASVFSYEAMSWIPDQPGEASANNAVDESVRTGQDLSTKTQKATVLLVDDNADIREYIKSILGQKFFVATAHNGVRALELIATGLKPHLIMADLMMPEMDGFALMNRIRQNVEISRVPFIMLSARASEEDILEGMRNGVDDYLIKPFSSIALLTLVKARIKRAFSQ